MDGRRADLGLGRALDSGNYAPADAAPHVGVTGMAAAVLAGVVGLSAVLAVQTQANARLVDEQAKVQARFELAQKAIAAFHTGVSEDILLRNDQFKELRTRLLKEAAGFYADMEVLLAGQTDARSRRALAAGIFQLAELTRTIGSFREALAVHRRALAIRRELAAEPGAEVESRLDLARSLRLVGSMLGVTGGRAAGCCRLRTRRYGIGRKAGGRSPDERSSVRLADIRSNIALLLYYTGNPAGALLAVHQTSVAIREKLGRCRTRCHRVPARTVVELQRHRPRAQDDRQGDRGLEAAPQGVGDRAVR